MTFFTFHGDLIADLIKSNFPLSLDFFIPKCHNKSRWQLLLEINHNLGPLRDSKGGPRGPRQKKKVFKRGVQKNRDHLMSLDILVSKYQKKIRSLPNFSESKIFLSPWCFLQSMEISLQIWSNKISLFLWISSYPNVTIRVGDNYFWKLITIWGPYGTQKGALGAPGKKKRFSKGGFKRIGIIWWV